MKTIAIITFSYSNKNYGQILQAYALQHYLELCGHCVFLINYQEGALERACPAASVTSDIKWLFKQLPILKRYVTRKYKRYKEQTNSDTRNFVEFRKKRIKYSSRQYETFFELKKNPPVADVYITGSDQTFSRCIRNSLVYTLGFVDASKKKIAYAASFGRKELQSFEKKDFKKYLSEYSAIGVREDSGVKVCQSLGIANAVFVPDPTILLTSSAWRIMSEGHSPFHTSKKKLFIYNCYQPFEAFVDKYRKISDYEVVIASVGSSSISNIISELSIEEWIAAIDDADYVITNSFHATMFSLYMNTKFVVFGYGDNHGSMNARLESILPMVGLKERFQPLSENPSTVLGVLRKEIDWEFVNGKIKVLRNVGVNFLSRNI